MGPANRGLELLTKLRGLPGWVAEGGVISVAGESFSVGRHLVYRIVTVAVNGRFMHIYLNAP